MKNEKDKTMAKARKLLALIENEAATEAEVFAASAALQRLLKEAGMTIEDVESEGSAPEVARDEAEDVARLEPWRQTIAKAVADAYRCKVYAQEYQVGVTVDGRRQKRSKIMFMGYPGDVELARAVYSATLAAAQNCWKGEVGAVKARVKDDVARRWYDLKDPLAARQVKRRVAEAKRSFLGGFAAGLKRAYSENVAADGELALAVVVPGAVREEYGKMALAPRRTKYKGYANSDSYGRGECAGYGVGAGDRLSA